MTKKGIAENHDRTHYEQRSLVRGLGEKIRTFMSRIHVLKCSIACAYSDW